MTDFEKNPELEEEFNEDIITLTDEETGEEEDFEIRDRAFIDEKWYFALAPVGDDSGELLVFRATVDGEDLLFEPIEDDDEYDKVEDYFYDNLFGEVDYDEE